MTAPVAAPEPDEEPADIVARRVLDCPAVDSLAGAGLGSVATYLPGRRVSGVSLRDDLCVVQVVLRLVDRPLPELADQVRQAVRPVVGDRRVDVLVVDVVPPPEATQTDSSSTGVERQGGGAPPSALPVERAP